MKSGLAAVALFVAAGTSIANASPLSVSSDRSGVSAQLSLADLDALPQAQFETTTIWTDGVQAFSGVSLSVLIEHVGAEGATLRMTALNDYAVTMPVEDVGEEFPIVATRMNGEEMSVRDKGPYWVVYPYDSDDLYQTEAVYSRSIWQLKDLMLMD